MPLPFLFFLRFTVFPHFRPPPVSRRGLHSLCLTLRSFVLCPFDYLVNAVIRSVETLSLTFSVFFFLGLLSSECSSFFNYCNYGRCKIIPHTVFFRLLFLYDVIVVFLWLN